MAEELVSKVKNGKFENSNFWKDFNPWLEMIEVSPYSEERYTNGEMLFDELINELMEHFIENLGDKKQEFYTEPLKHLPDSQELKGFNDKLAKLDPEAFYAELTK